MGMIQDDRLPWLTEIVRWYNDYSSGLCPVFAKREECLMSIANASSILLIQADYLSPIVLVHHSRNLMVLH